MYGCKYHKESRMVLFHLKALDTFLDFPEGLIVSILSSCHDEIAYKILFIS